jgi:hypothetical protein
MMGASEKGTNLSFSQVPNKVRAIEREDLKERGSILPQLNISTDSVNINRAVNGTCQISSNRKINPEVKSMMSSSTFEMDKNSLASHKKHAMITIDSVKERKKENESDDDDEVSFDDEFKRGLDTTQMQ